MIVGFYVVFLCVCSGSDSASSGSKFIELQRSLHSTSVYYGVIVVKTLCGQRFHSHKTYFFLYRRNEVKITLL